MPLCAFDLFASHVSQPQDYWPVDAFFNRSNSTNLTEMMNLNFTNLSHWNSWNLTNLTYDNASNWTEYAGPPMPLMELAPWFGVCGSWAMSVLSASSSFSM